MCGVCCVCVCVCVCVQLGSAMGADIAAQVLAGAKSAKK